MELFNVAKSARILAAGVPRQTHPFGIGILARYKQLVVGRHGAVDNVVDLFRGGIL